MTRVVDASVVVAWYAGEENSVALMRHLGQPLVAPGLMWIELANALWSKARRREIDPTFANAALTDAEANVTRLNEWRFTARAFTIACDIAHPVYDCVYLASAEALELTLLTADLRFARACAGTRYAGLIELAVS